MEQCPEKQDSGMGGSPQREGAEVVLRRRAVVYAGGLLLWLLPSPAVPPAFPGDRQPPGLSLKLPLGWFGLHGDGWLAFLMQGILSLPY